MALTTRNQVQVKGLKELHDLLIHLPVDLQKKVMAEALRKAANPVRYEAEMLAPRGDKLTAGSSRDYGGHLADQIVISSAKLFWDGNGAIGVGPARDAYWGYFTELGTKRGVEAVHWLETALANTWEEAMGIMEVHIRRFLETQKTGVF